MQSYLPLLRDQTNLKTILLDANFIIDAYRQWGKFQPAIEFLVDNQATLTTTAFVALEVLRGYRSPDELEAKKDFIKELTKGYLLPIVQDTNEIALDKIVRLYGINGGKPHIADLYLAAMTVQYERSTGLLILTRNIHDFPDHIFDTVGIIPIETSPCVTIYGIMKYSPQKAQRVLN